MQMLALAFVLFGVANPDPGQLPESACFKQMTEALQTFQVICTGAEFQKMLDEDIAVFLAGGESLLGRMFKQLDEQGRLTEVLDHTQRARVQWRRGKPTPKAPGH